MGSQFDNKEASPFEKLSFEKLDVNGFPVNPSQVETARSIFERDPNIASEFPKDETARSFYMAVLLNVTEGMSQPTHNISKDNLSDAKEALALLKSAGLNLKWLEERLEEVSSELKQIAETGEKPDARIED